MSKTNVLVMGGFTESKRLLEPVAAAAVEQGFGQDADVLTLRDALNMDYERLRSFMAGKNVIAHSAAVVPVPDARHVSHASELPRNFAIVGAPEPRGVVGLARSALTKTSGHMLGATATSSRRRVAASNMAETLTHPLANLSMVPDISRFSTRGRISCGHLAAAVKLDHYEMSGDELYPASQDPTVKVLNGSHDELLFNPAGVLAGVSETFEEEIALAV